MDVPRAVLEHVQDRRQAGLRVALHGPRRDQLLFRDGVDDVAAPQRTSRRRDRIQASSPPKVKAARMIAAYMADRTAPIVVVSSP